MRWNCFLTGLKSFSKWSKSQDTLRLGPIFIWHLLVGVLNKIQIFWIIIPFMWYRPSIYILQSTFLKFTYSIKYELAMLPADWPQTGWNMCLHVCCSMIKQIVYCFLMITMVTKLSQLSNGVTFDFIYECIVCFVWSQPASGCDASPASTRRCLLRPHGRKTHALIDLAVTALRHGVPAVRVQENIPFSHLIHCTK